MIRRVLLLFGLLATQLTVFACECIGDELSAQNALRSSYVALVKIVRVAPYKRPPNKYADQPYYAAEIREIKRYKGAAHHELIIAGGLPALGTWTSCDQGLDVGEEWLVFGTTEEATFIYPCSYTIRFRAADGFQELQHGQAFGRVHLLDSLTHQLAAPSRPPNGLVLSRYLNKQVQKSEQFRRGVLHGAVAYYYPDGRPYATKVYSNGQLDGREKWYRPNGSLEWSASYRQGLRQDTATFYYPSRQGPPLPYFRYLYNEAGQIIKSQRFAIGSTGQYLDQETEYEPANNKETNRYYYPSGQLRSLGYQVRGKGWGTYQDFDEQGQVVRQWQYDENGRVIKPSSGSKN